MAAVARIPRRRGGVCGLLLILLGAWGGLAPFVGPYFHFAYTPDKAWAYTTGRLYLSVIPGAIALLAGIAVLLTRSRALGVVAGLLAAVAGAWFIVGAGFTQIILKQTTISAGVPVPRTGAGFAGAQWSYLEQLGFFTAVGILIIGLGAIVMGRFSMLAASDAIDAQDVNFDEFPASQPEPAMAEQVSHFTPGPRPFPGEEPTQTQDVVPPFGGTGQFPAPSPSPFPPAQPPSTYPRSTPR